MSANSFVLSAMLAGEMAQLEKENAGLKEKVRKFAGSLRDCQKALAQARYQRDSMAGLLAHLEKDPGNAPTFEAWRKGELR